MHCISSLDLHWAWMDFSLLGSPAIWMYWLFTQSSLSPMLLTQNPICICRESSSGEPGRSLNEARWDTFKRECEEVTHKEPKPAVSRLNERLTGILQWLAGETLCLSKENRKLRSGLPGWTQEQKEEATWNHRAESVNRVSFSLVNLLQSLKGKRKCLEFLLLWASEDSRGKCSPIKGMPVLYWSTSVGSPEMITPWNRRSVGAKRLCSEPVHSLHIGNGLAGSEALISFSSQIVSWRNWGQQTRQWVALGKTISRLKTVSLKP